MTLSSTSKRMVVEEALSDYTEDFEVETERIPHRIRIGRKERHFLLHEVGDTNRGRADECRIQTSVHSRKALASKAPSVAVLGFLPKLGVLTAWDPRPFVRRTGGSTVFSLYSRYSVQDRAAKNGVAVYVDDEDQHVVTMRPVLLGAYLQNLELFHDSNEAQLRSAVGKIPKDPSKGVDVRVKGVRQKFSFTRTQYPRDPRFVAAVKTAYNHACAMCGTQLDLIEAAHIVPHGVKSSADDVTNGIALCPLHHRAFDRGLVKISARFQILVDRPRAKSLRSRKRDEGLANLEVLHSKQIGLPIEKSSWPSVEAIKKRQRHIK